MFNHFSSTESRNGRQEKARGRGKLWRTTVHRIEWKSTIMALGDTRLQLFSWMHTATQWHRMIYYCVHKSECGDLRWIWDEVLSKCMLLTWAQPCWGPMSQSHGRLARSFFLSQVGGGKAFIWSKYKWWRLIGQCVQKLATTASSSMMFTTGD